MRKLIPVAVLLALTAGCKRPAASVTTPQPAPGGPGPVQPVQNHQPNVHAPSGVVTNPNTGGGGGGGAAGAVRKAVKRAATQNDLRQLHLTIEAYFNENNRMPKPQELAESLRTGAPNVYKLWEEQSIGVTKLERREGIWAYTTDTVSTAGYHLVVTNSSANEKMDPQTLRQKLTEQGDKVIRGE